MCTFHFELRSVLPSALPGLSTASQSCSHSCGVSSFSFFFSKARRPWRPWRLLFLSYSSPLRRISGTYRLMETGGRRQKACAGLCGVSLVRERGCLAPTDIYQHNWKCHGMPAFTSGCNGVSYSPEQLIPNIFLSISKSSPSPCPLLLRKTTITVLLRSPPQSGFPLYLISLCINSYGSVGGGC